MKKCIFLLFIFFGCKSKTVSEIWFEKTKEVIIENSNKYCDNSILTENKTGFEKNSFSEDILIKKEFFRKNKKLSAEILYSDNGNFEFRREFYENGNIAFEGIVYNNSFYGLSVWWYNNGQKQEQGIRFRNKKIGIWKKWNSKGELIEFINYKNEFLIDSLKYIK